jgi:phosphomannomutase
MTLNADIFKAYDIRGLYGSQIDGELAEQIGRAFARVPREPLGQADRRAARRRSARHAPQRARALRALPRRADRRGRHVLDAGQVGDRGLYYLVGSNASWTAA